MTLDEKIDTIQNRFDALDALHNSSAEEGSFRCWSVADLTLYFVHDVCGITSNAGLPAWVFYHGQTEAQEEVVEAVAAFRRLHLHAAADALGELLSIYRERGNKFPEKFDGRVYSSAIWDHTETIYDTLYAYTHSTPGA